MFFSPFYEFFENLLGLFDTNFSIVFQTLFNNGGYNTMGFILIGIPLVFLILFYFLWKYPYATFWHWFIYIGFIALIVAGLTYSMVSSGISKMLVHSNPLIAEFSESLVLSYTILNACLSLIVSFIYSLILRKFSKIQMHLPLYKKS